MKNILVLFIYTLPPLRTIDYVIMIIDYVIMYYRLCETHQLQRSLVGASHTLNVWHPHFIFSADLISTKKNPSRVIFLFLPKCKKLHFFLNIPQDIWAPSVGGHPRLYPTLLSCQTIDLLLSRHLPTWKSCLKLVRSCYTPRPPPPASGLNVQTFVQTVLTILHIIQYNRTTTMHIIIIICLS